MLWLLLALACAPKGRVEPVAVEPPAPGPVPAATPTAPPAPAPVPPPLPAGPCVQPTFDATADGVVVTVEGKAYRFRAGQELGTSSYNYTRRTVRMTLVSNESGDPVSPEVSTDASCHAETDCTAPDDPTGHTLTCLVPETHVANPLFPLYREHALCPTSFELLERIVQHSDAPTCFRVGLGTSPDWVAEKLGEAQYDLELDRTGDHTALIALIEGCFPLLEEAESLRDDEPATAILRMEEVRRRLAPHVAHEAIWEADATAQAALARLRKRYPYTLVGPGDTVYDVVPDADLISGRFEDVVRPVAAPWDGSLRPTR